MQQFLGTLHQQDRQVVIMAHQPHKMNVKKQWQHWLLRMEEYLEEVYNTELVARAMMVDGSIYH
jgi:hypothetical protein